MGACTPSPTRSQSDAMPLARTSSPAGRHSSGSSSSRRAASPSPTSSRRACLDEALREIKAAVERPDLHPAGDPLGLPRPGPQRRPVLPRRGRPPDRPPRLAGAAAVQLRDGGLLPGAEAPARAVLRRRGPPRGAEPGRAGRPAMALEGPPRLPVRRVDGLDARHAGEPARSTR